ncbi:MAG TPA: PH domain-containing protein [Sporichthyaceae bacterium]|nr:PH domain-containing protein [Sporichthyaceae bacterium]
MSRPLGLGPIPGDQSFTGSKPLVVRQAASLFVGCFVAVIMVTMGIGVLIHPGETVGSGNAFIDRWFFGILIVPALWSVDRFLLRPRVRVDAAGVEFHNPMQTIVANWPAVVSAGFDSHVRLVLGNGDYVRSILFGPGLSSPMTQRTRPDELAHVINVEAARRSGRQHDPQAAYEAEELVGGSNPAPRPTGPGAELRPAHGLVNLAGYAIGWTVACIVAARLATR